LAPEEQARVTELDVRWMIEQARARSIPFVAILYPFGMRPFTTANAGIRAAAEAYGVTSIDTQEAARRIASSYEARGEKAPGLFDHTLHPNQMFYDAIGDLVIEKLDALGYL